MALLDTEIHRRKGSVRGRESRNQTVTTKLTEAEFALVETASISDGKAVGEWLRDAALDAMHAEAKNGQYTIVFSEIIGVRLLLVNVLRSIATGQVMLPETFDKLLDEIAGAKHEVAEKLATEGRK